MIRSPLIPITAVPGHPSICGSVDPIGFDGFDVISVGFSGIPNNGTPYPYDSYTTPTRIPKDTGIVWVPLVWEAYHNKGPIIGSPWGITLENLSTIKILRFQADHKSMSTQLAMLWRRANGECYTARRYETGFEALE